MKESVDLSALNAMTRPAFVDALDGVFERSPWVAERAWSDRPFVDVDGLHECLAEAVRTASAQDQLALLRAHPELAGREAQAGQLTAESGNEQTGAGLNALSREKTERIRRLNSDYRVRFGFPFIIAVRHHTVQGILEQWVARLDNTPREELANALDQVFAIARLRLDARVRATP